MSFWGFRIYNFQILNSAFFILHFAFFGLSSNYLLTLPPR